MVDPERDLLSGLVEVDETALPFHTKHDPLARGAGRSHDGKLLVVGAIEVGSGNMPGRLRLAEIASYGADTGTTITAKTTSTTAPIMRSFSDLSISGFNAWALRCGASIS